MDDRDPQIQGPTMLVHIALGMLSGALEGIGQALATITPPRRTELARALERPLDEVEQVLTRLRKFVGEIRTDA
jgi:hypothetical protein